MECTYTSEYGPPIVLGVLWVISEGLSFVPEKYVKANSILQLLTTLLSKAFTKKPVSDQELLVHNNA